MKYLKSFALTCAVVVASSAPLQAKTAVSGPPVEIPVITSTTGYLAFLGKEQQHALTLLEQVVNSQQGGVRGHPVRFVVHDDQSNPQVALQLANKIMAESHSPVLLGPQVTSSCNAVYPVLKTGPVMYCLSPAFQAPTGGFGFASNTNTNDQAVAAIRYLRQRGWTRIAFLTTIDASGQALDKGFAAAFALPENRDVQLVAHEHFAATDLSVMGQLAKIRATNPQALVAWAAGTPTGTVLRNIRDAGFDLPVVGGSANMTYAQMAEYAAFMPKQLLFPGLRAMSRNGTATGPIRDAQTAYFNAFAADGSRPDASDNLIWDPALLLVDTLRHIGPEGSAEAARSYLSGLHNFFGINGLYDFRDGSQRGLGLGAVIMDRWNAAANDFVAVSKPGGAVK